MRNVAPAANDADSYHYRRAEAELGMAQAATEPAVVKAHFDLANLHLEQLHGPSDAQAGPND